jgi:hypothetical protein
VCAIIQLTFDTVIVVQFIVFSSYFKKLFGIGNAIRLAVDDEDTIA